MMKKLMHIFFLSCLKATELIEKKIHFKLSWKEGIQLRGHKMMCKACTNYEKQSIFLENGISNLPETKLPRQEDIDEIKEMIKLRFKELN